ncbi:MAG TPA: hypothetical protein VGK22_13375 [Candidatus Angelobacter sp.]
MKDLLNNVSEFQQGYVGLKDSGMCLDRRIVVHQALVIEIAGKLAAQYSVNGVK